MEMDPGEDSGNFTNKPFLWKVGIVVGGGGLIFGYDIGVIAGALSQLKDEFGLSGFLEGLVVSILYCGAIFGSIVGGPLCDYLGRWKTIHLQNVVFIVGAIVTATASDITSLCMGRFIVGISSAISGIADVPYLTEISPSESRGYLTCQYEILVCIGVLVSFIVDLVFSGLDNGWRIDFAIPAILALLQSIGMLWLPESPKWLIERGMLDEARKTLVQIYGENAVDRLDLADLEEYKNAITKERAKPERVTSSTVVRSPIQANQSMAPIAKVTSDDHDNEDAAAARSSSHQSISDLLKQDGLLLQLYRYPMILVVIIQVLAQFTGGVVIRNYAPIIFEDSGVSDSMALVYNVVLGVVKLLFTVASVNYVDSTGRVALLLYGVSMVFVGMLFLTLASMAVSTGSAGSVAIYMVGCSLTIGGYGIGYGPIPWILSSEMFPTAIRGKIMSISLIASNFAQFLTNLIFVVMVDEMTAAGTFGFFLFMNLATFLFVQYFLIETMEKSPDEILKTLTGFYELSVGKLLCRKRD